MSKQKSVVGHDDTAGLELLENERGLFAILDIDSDKLLTSWKRLNRDDALAKFNNWDDIFCEKKPRW